MIARIAILLLILIVAADACLYWQYLRRSRLWVRLLWWVPCLAMVAYTLVLTFQKGFMPTNPTLLYVYLFLLGVVVIPKLLLAICSFFGRWGRRIGWVLVALTIYIVVYGSFIGFQKLEVTRVEIAFDDLPEAFDGYRIVQFSDAHVGTFTNGREDLLRRAVDSINAQHADAIMFTGDLQNIRPEEVRPHMEVLSKLKAKDGVFSVMGNHDYGIYTGEDEYLQYHNEKVLLGIEQDMGWDLIVNSHRWLRRGKDIIVLAGLANESTDPRFPKRANLPGALWGTKRDRFIIMLEHDPSAWRSLILPHSHAQLTLSGHTHAMQFSLFGWSPMSLRAKEVDGLYEINNRYLYVSKGLGGLIPFRFGATGEIVVITLRKKH